MMETRYKTEIIREWTIIDLVFNGDKALDGYVSQEDRSIYKF